MEILYEKIKSILNSQFEKELFEASLASLNDKSNKLRYNNFAYSIRELSRHFLYSLAPEDNIKNCSWYKSENEDCKITRSQRIKYAIQGGIADETLQNLDFDITLLRKAIKSMKETIDSLSKYTHINEDVFNIESSKVESLSKDVIITFSNFVEEIIDYRERLKKFLDGKIEEHMISSIVYQSFVNIDSLAPHYSLEYGEVSDYRIDEINDTNIIVCVSGNIYVTLEYGSRQERSEDDGLDVEQSFPFETKIAYEIDDTFPSEKYEIEEFDVDTSDWYGDNDYEDIP